MIFGTVSILYHLLCLAFQKVILYWYKQQRIAAFNLYILVIGFRTQFSHTTFASGAFHPFDLLLHDNYRHPETLFTHACVCGKKKKRILKTLQFTIGNRIVLRGLFRCKWIIWKQNKSLSENTILLQWVSLLTPDPNQPLLALHYG